MAIDPNDEKYFNRLLTSPVLLLLEQRPRRHPIADGETLTVLDASNTQERAALLGIFVGLLRFDSVAGVAKSAR